MNNFVASIVQPIKNEVKFDLNVIFCDVVLCMYIFILKIITQKKNIKFRNK